MAGQTSESNLSWLDWSYPEALSADGRLLLFDEQNRGEAGGNYSVYLRRVGGAAPVRLGDGRSHDISPDGKWALVERRSPEGSRLVLLPTGAGEPRVLPALGTSVQSASFFADGTRIVVFGEEPGKGARLFVVPLDGGSRRPISPEGTTMHRWRGVSPVGRWVLAGAPDGALTLYATEDGQGKPLPGAAQGDVPIRWTADGGSVYVQRGLDAPAHVDLIDVATGARRPWKELRPPDPAGVQSIGPVRVSADGESYVYSYRRIEDQLTLMNGVR
jgi:Tol biopolymer transport system component